MRLHPIENLLLRMTFTAVLLGVVVSAAGTRIGTVLDGFGWGIPNLLWLSDFPGLVYPTLGGGVFGGVPLTLGYGR